MTLAVASESRSKLISNKLASSPDIATLNVSLSPAPPAEPTPTVNVFSASEIGIVCEERSAAVSVAVPKPSIIGYWKLLESVLESPSVVSSVVLVELDEPELEESVDVSVELDEPEPEESVDPDESVASDEPEPDESVESVESVEPDEPDPEESVESVDPDPDESVESVESVEPDEPDPDESST